MFMWILLIISYLVILGLVDYLIRKKHWRDNSLEEKRSLLVYFGCGIVYLVFSMIGVFVGISGEPYESGVGIALFNIAAYMSMATPAVCAIVSVLNIMLRKKNEFSKSNRIHLLAIIYILVSLLLSFIADAI